MYALIKFMFVLAICAPFMIYSMGSDEWRAFVTGQATATQKWIASGGFHCSIAWFLLAPFSFMDPLLCRCGRELTSNPNLYEKICSHYQVVDSNVLFFEKCRACSTVRDLSATKDLLPGDKGEIGPTGKGPSSGCADPWCAPHGAPGVCSENGEHPLCNREIKTTPCVANPATTVRDDDGLGETGIRGETGIKGVAWLTENFPSEKKNKK